MTKHLTLVKNSKYRYQRVLAIMIYKFFDWKSSCGNTSGGAIKSKIKPNRKLAEELH